MKEPSRQPDAAAYHYSNGSVAPCEDEGCNGKHLTLEQATKELATDASQGPYQPRHAQTVKS